MVRLTQITTRGGDCGQTSLGDGQRVSKASLRIEALGTVDEANASIGVARLYMSGAEEDSILADIQNDLFDLGADLCIPYATEGEQSTLRVTGQQVEQLESATHAVNATLPPLNSFVMPHGTPAATHLHMARTIVRRAERCVVALDKHEAINPNGIVYLNRLSDFLFVLARLMNDSKGDEDLWQPGQGTGHSPPKSTRDIG